MRARALDPRAANVTLNADVAPSLGFGSPEVSLEGIFDVFNHVIKLLWVFDADFPVRAFPETD